MTYKTIFFDLDETLYPAPSPLWLAIRDRIGLYMEERVHLPVEQIPELRKRLFLTYGTTMRGLQALYHIDPQDYLAYVHDVPLTDFIQPDPQVRAVIASYPQRKVIFTNADANHARRVIGVLQLEGLFDQIVDINDIEPYCKPQTEAFEIALRAAGEADPSRCVLVDDSPANLKAARQIGFFTIRAGGEPNPDEYDAAVARLADLPNVLPRNGSGPGE